MKNNDETSKLVEIALKMREKNRQKSQKNRDKKKKCGMIQKNVWSYPPNEQMKKAGYTKSVVIYVSENDYKELTQEKQPLFAVNIHVSTGKYNKNNKEITEQNGFWVMVKPAPKPNPTAAAPKTTA